MIQYNLLRRRLERWSNFKIQVFIYCYQRGKFQQHLPHNLWGSDVARTFLFYFSKICNIFLTKVQLSYCYTKLCNYREEFVFKPIIKHTKYSCVLQLSFTRSLNDFYFQMIWEILFWEILDVINFLYYKQWTDNWKYISYISVTHQVLKSSRSKMATFEHDVCDVHGASSLYIKPVGKV